MSLTLRRAVASVLSAAMLLGLAVPPPYAHAHPSSGDSSKSDHAEAGCAYCHGVHTRHHHKHASHSHDAIEHPSGGEAGHVHWHVLFFDFTFPVSSQQDGEDDCATTLALLQESPSSIISPADRVLLPLIAVYGPAIVEVDAIQLDCESSANARPVVAGPLCDAARLARTGVLIA